MLSASERQRLVSAMRKFFGGTVDSSHGRGQVLSDQKATNLFDGFCSRSFAGAFKLYKLYGRAAAFTAPSQ